MFEFTYGKLRTSASNGGCGIINGIVEVDPFIEVCRFILLLVEIYPDACGMRETRHGCLPLHLAAFASCIRTSNTNHNSASQNNDAAAAAAALSPANSTFSTYSLSSALPSPASATATTTTQNFDDKAFTDRTSATISKPAAVTNYHRCASESTVDTMRTTMSAAIAEENCAGIQSVYHNEYNQQQQLSGRQRSHLSIQTESSIASQISAAGSPLQQQQQQQKRVQSVSIGSHVFISEKREDYALKVLNSLLDAYPRGIRMESEGKRLALHTAAAGRATPRVITTLVTAYPAATRHRNTDGFLPLHLCAHWGISHPNVVITMLKQYPDATFGRNRWERTPLEEALCMAGENGRPHQPALVRALRKHPTYWERPEGVLFHQARQNPPSSHDAKHNIVDIDETLASMEDTMHDDDDSDDDLFLDNSPYYDDSRNGQYGRPRTNNGPQAKGKEVLSPVVNDLPTLIRNKSWEAAAQRLKTNPTESNLNLKVITRGGFTSTLNFTPLHYACERRPPKAFIETLIRLCPEAVAKRTMPGGGLPLHIACTWYAKKDVVDILLTDRNACKTQDELGNLPIHSACFSGTSSAVVEAILKAYPKAVLARNHQGSLPEDITKRLKHENRVSVLALLNLCTDEVVTKRKMKHRRNRSDGYAPTTKEAIILNERYSHVNPISNYETIENIDSGEIEVKYSGESTAEKDLMWI